LYRRHFSCSPLFLTDLDMHVRTSPKQPAELHSILLHLKMLSIHEGFNPVFSWLFPWDPGIPLHPHPLSLATKHATTAERVDLPKGRIQIQAMRTHNTTHVHICTTQTHKVLKDIHCKTNCLWPDRKPVLQCASPQQSLPPLIQHQAQIMTGKTSNTLL